MAKLLNLHITVNMEIHEVVAPGLLFQKTKRHYLCPLLHSEYNKQRLEANKPASVPLDHKNRILVKNTTTPIRTV